MTSSTEEASRVGEILIQATGASKKFCRSLKKSLWYGVCDIASDVTLLRRRSEIPQKTSNNALVSQPEPRLRSGEFWAVHDVSFELRRGECLGLIGRNGAGKTTLLKMLNGLIKPDTGSITMRGRVGALIALGAGFNPILTGRENIYVNGSILGLKKREIDEKIDEIIDFAEIGDFIDSPVQSYSSGMQVRLGFAVATALTPDILILDEVLAVGDAAFRAKCYQRISEIRKNAAVIFVTHSMEQLSRICDKTLVMSKGTVRYSGDVAGGVRAYESLNEVGQQQEQAFVYTNDPVEEFAVLSVSPEVRNGGSLEVTMKARMKTEPGDYKLRITFYNLSGAVVGEVNEAASCHNYRLTRGDNAFKVRIPNTPLRVGQYPLGINLIDEKGDITAWSYKQKEVNVVGTHMGGNTDCQIPVSLWEKI